MENLPVPGPRKRTPGGGPWWYARGDLNPYPCGMEPKGDVTLVKDFKNPKYLQSSAPSHPLSTLPLNAGR